jgi:drug/metabolite transporter (DMT)-like permease
VTPRLKGIALILVSIVLFSMLDTTAKFTIQTVPQPVAVFFRYFIALILATALLVPQGGARLVRTSHLGLHVLRGLMLVTSTFLNFLAMHHLQLAQTAAIFFTIPLWVCGLSVLLLGEEVGPRRWAAVGVGFLGVLVIMRPGTTSFHPAMLASVASSICGAFYNIGTRKVGGTDRAETSLFYVCIVGVLGAAIPTVWTWRAPQGVEWLLLCGLGLFGCIGHLLLGQAHRLAPASVLAPFVYTQIIWMILFGFIVFGDWPDRWTLIGGAIVVASGLYVFARERTLGISRPVPALED